MATSYIYNGFGQYDTKNGEKGIWLTMGGERFWFPYKKTTPISNFTFREVDHEKSTPERGQFLMKPIYRETNVMGHEIAVMLTENQVPVPYRDMGIQIVEGESTGESVLLFAGLTANGMPIMIEVPERLATPSEVRRAEDAALAYKKQNIAEYFQSKRERMAGGQGKLIPDKMTRVFMDELNVEDIDDVTAHSKHSGITPELLAELMKLASQAGGTAVAENLVNAVKTVRNNEKAQLAPKKSLGLAKNKAAWDAAHPEETVK